MTWLTTEASLCHGCSKPSLPTGPYEMGSCLSLGPIPGVSPSKLQGREWGPGSQFKFFSSKYQDKYCLQNNFMDGWKSLVLGHSILDGSRRSPKPE